MAFQGTNVFLGSTLVGQTYLGDTQIEYTPYDFTPATYTTSGSVLLLDASSSISYPGTGNTWFDLSGNGNNAALTSMASYYTASNGGYFDFPDNTNNYMTVTQSGSLNNAFVGNFTIDMWITIDTINNGDWTGPLGKPNQTKFAFIIYCGPTPSGLVRWYINGGEYNYASYLTLSAGAWINLQFVRTGTSFTMYQNTVSLGSVTVSGDLSNTDNFIIGKPWNASIYPLDGKMGWFGIYNRALSTTELTQNYNTIKTRYGL